MRLGVFAKTFPGKTPDAVLAQVAASGYAAAQYNMACSGLASMPDAIAPDIARAVADASRAHGVAIAAVSGTYNMAHPDPAVRAKGLARLEVLAGAAHAMGTSLITLCTGTRDPDDQWRLHKDNVTAEAWADMRAAMVQAIAIAERHDIRLGIEPELSNVVSSATKARQLLDELQSERLVVVLDAANLFETEPLDAQRRIIAQAVDAVGDRIVMAHAKDRAADGSFVAAGTGVLDYPHYIACLRAVGFDGDLVPHSIEADEAPGVARFLSGLIA
jgi:sugar phosphate isomerase/epimerase